MTFDPEFTVSDLYHSWPYASRYVRETYDPDLIEAQAVLMLSRALAIRRTVAFVGAGVSMSYGRISWQDLVRELTERALHKVSSKAQPHFADIDRLVKSLKSLQLDWRTDVQPDRYPMMFQLCEQLQKAMEEADDLSQAQSAEVGAGGFRAEAMGLTLDDRGHAEIILRSAVTDGVGREAFPKKLKDDYFTDNKHGYHAIYRAETLVSLRDALSATTPPLVKPLLDTIVEGDKFTGWSKSGYLMPTHRYLVGVLLRAFPQAERADQIKSCAGAPVTEAPARHELIPRSRDPLRILHDHLGVRRFITTNYDQEIEHLFKVSGYAEERESHPTSDASSRFDEAARGAHMGQWSSIVFDDKKSGELAAFSADAHTSACRVIHLHGRAESQGGSIVVTENDYQRRYLRSDETRDQVDDAIRLAFGSNPILFVGSNMGEDDILRPLRQFVSTPARTKERQVIAMVPATRARANIIEEKIALLGRYGVHLIHFGRAARAGKASHGPLSLRERDALHVDWLEWFWSIKSTIQDALEPFDRLEQDFVKAADESEFDATIEKIAEFLGPKKRPSTKQNKPITLAEGSPPLLASPDMLEGIDCSQHEGLCIGLEIRIVNQAINFLRQFKDEPPRDRASWRRSVQAYRTAVIGAGDAILSAFTCARLLRAQLDFEEWNKKWFAMPAPAAGSDVSEDCEGKITATCGLKKISRRHSLVLPLLPSNDPRHGRFYACAPSETLEDLLRALSSEDGQRFRAAVGRRILLLVARRGVGGGHLFASLQTNEKAKDASVGPQTDEKAKEAPVGPQTDEKAKDASVGPQTDDKAKDASVGPQTDDKAKDASVGPQIDEKAKEASVDLPEVVFNNPLRRLLESLGRTHGLDRLLTQWRAATFHNLSFSREVMSVFDRIIGFLETQYIETAGIPGLDKRAFEAQLGNLTTDRIGRFGNILNLWATQRAFEDGSRQAQHVQQRLLVAINGLHVLFDPDGAAKNGQIKRLFNLLLSSDNDRAPLDFIFCCRDNGIPKDFRLPSVGGTMQFMRLVSAVPAVSTENERRMYEARVGLVAVAGATSGNDDKHHVSGAGLNAYHVLEPANPAAIALAFFPRIPLLVAHKALAEAENPKIAWLTGEAVRKAPTDELANVYDRENGFKFSAKMLQIHQELNAKASVDFNDICICVALLLSIYLDRGHDGDVTLVDDFRKLVNERIEAAENEKEAATSERTRTSSRQHAKIDTFVLGKLAFEVLRSRQLVVDTVEACFLEAFEAETVEACFYEAFEAAARVLRGRIDRLFTAVGRNRFLFTALIAAAHEHTKDLEIDKEPLHPETHASVVRSVNDFLDRVEGQVAGLEDVQGADLTIRQILEMQRRRHERREKLPIELGSQIFSKSPTDGHIDQFTLQNEIVWALSIISQPVSDDVLLVCPNVARATDALVRRYTDKDTYAGKSEKERAAKQKEAVGDILILAQRRCLVFEIAAANPRADPGAPEKEPRYTVHRFVQRHVFHQLGAPDVEIGEADRYSISLYASQPNDLPRIHPQAHRLIRNTLAALAKYPESGQRWRLPEGNHAYRLLKDQVRAALGVIRSIYSIGVLARFRDPSETAEEDRPEAGHFEDYRRILRWLLKLASHLSEWSRKDSKGEDVIGTFFAEEIVWLFNECGVLSLVQGRLSDALALFRQARTAARRLEPRAGGPLQVRILLNRSVVDIERGQLGRARRNLADILKIPAEDEVPFPMLIARGYLGLVEHLTGNLEFAQPHYVEAIERLTALRRTRAASIFARHLGDLQRAKKSWKEASGSLQRSIHLAQEGNHEDVLQHAILARAHLVIAQNAAGAAREV